MNNIKIGIVDDSLIILRMLSMLFKATAKPAFEVVFELESCNQFELFKFFPVAPQVVLMDVDMPGIKGVDGIPLLLNRYPDCQVIMFTERGDLEVIRKCMKAGASGYLIKNARREELIYAIMTVLKGEFYISSNLTIQVLSILQNSSVYFPTLSDLEYNNNLLSGILNGVAFNGQEDKTLQLR